MSSADDSHSAQADFAVASATNHTRVISEQMRAFLLNLVRQAVIFARSAARQAQIWWHTLRVVIQSAHTSFAERSPGLKARLQSSIKTTAWPTLGPRLSGQYLRVMPKAWRNPWAMKFRAKYLAVYIVLGLVVLFGFALYSIATLPIGGGLQVEATQSALTFEGAQGDVFATRGVFKGDKLTAADLPPHLAQAIVAIEDRRFYQHNGVDPWGILRAGWRNSQAGTTREGGSTITQQLARLMFLTPERTWRRKLQEAILAVWLESQLAKEDILLRYLNTAYFGAGAYGVDAAARRYFGKKARELGLGEAAMLAGLVRAPSQLAPTRNFGGARERQDLVLQAMVETKAITAAEAEAARAVRAIAHTSGNAAWHQLFCRHGCRRRPAASGLVVR